MLLKLTIIISQKQHELAILWNGLIYLIYFSKKDNKEQVR